MELIGATLLFLGWLVSVGEKFPWQATAVSGLALHFFAQRLRRYWLRRDLLAIFVIGLQALLLIRGLIPNQFRRDAIALSIQIAHSEVFPQSVYSITLFPYVIFFVWLTDWLYLQGKPKLARFGEWLTLGLGIVLTLISLFNPTWRSLNLLISTATLAFVTQRRTPIRVPLLYLTHLLGLLAISAIIDWWFPNLTQSVWASILLVLMVAEWSISTLQQSASDSPLKQIWYRSCWHIGFALASLSYLLLWNETETFLFTGESQQWGLLWLLTPLTLTGVASRTGGRRRIQALSLSCIALGLAQYLTLWQPGVRLIGLGFATGLMFVNTRYLRHQVAAAIHIAFALSFIAALLWEQISLSAWFLVGAIAIIILWLLRTLLGQRPGTLAALYARAADGWAIVLCLVELAMLTLHYFSSNLQLIFPSWEYLVVSSWEYLVASALIGGSIIYRFWQQPNNPAVYGVSWAVEICIAEGIMLVGGSTLALATANIILALFTLLLANWLLSGESRLSRLTSLETLPLLYALIGIGWRLEYFNTYTGLLTLGAALTGIWVGCRRREWKIITYFSLAGISLAWYELVIYQMLQAPGGSPADGLTILAVVAAAIALIYRVFAWFWQSQGNDTFLNLSVTEIKITAHIHWAIGSILKLLTAGFAVESTPRLTPISIAVSLILGAYALVQGRDAETRGEGAASDWWVYVGLVEIAGTAVYARLIWTQLSVLDPWRAILACVVAFAIYQMPWRSWGWQVTPWHRAALVIPALTALVTMEDLDYLSLLVVAAFYARIAIRQRNIRWSYVSLGFIDWAIARWLSEQQLTDILWYASILGLSLLYIAQFDPELKTPQQRRNRHHLRIFGSGIICLVALLFHQDTALIPSLISLVVIFAGLGLRIRAFLFVGTATFVLTVFYQLIVLILEYPFSKWVIGLIAGIIFISIAANFERRREQIIMVLQNWIAQLNQWE
ncbi:MAG: hypothetical protein AB4426_31600 [Xenococcaceae cyanobacterium]